MHLVVGLGNPGRKYENTRHNAGFLVVDRLGARWDSTCDKKQFGALVGSVRMGGQAAMLAKPQSFMNRSGQPVASLKGYFKAETEDIVVVHDDVDLPFGRVKVKIGGGHGGHNGLRDLAAKLGGNGFVRVRFGVSRPPPGWDTADYVLGRFTETETASLDDAIDRAADAVEAVLRDGPKDAMNSFNIKERPAISSGTAASGARPQTGSSNRPEESK
jgi:peptidyl-tRNA hydrolase, PTH1 family